MPRCEGLPTGPCPGKRHNSSVKLGEGDLTLCKYCDQLRHKLFLESKSNAAKSDACELAVENSNDDVKETTYETSSQTDSPAFVVNEVLSYVNFYRDKSAAEKLRKVVISFFSPSEINTAKN